MTQLKDNLITLSPCPHPSLSAAYETLFSEDALDFLIELVTTFDQDCDKLQWRRKLRKYLLKSSAVLPEFSKRPERNNKSWKVRPLPPKLQDRRLDLGDVSPANKGHFLAALNADVQGIQVDFDDGHCPTWKNQIMGLYNVYCIVHGNINGLKAINELPLLMLRPRAWNMIEHNILINGKKVSGPLVDFGILMFHNAKILLDNNCGPCFYLSKLEGAEEAKLWNDVFIWSQNKLKIPIGSIKACVLIENILSSFEMDEILFQLKEHSLGLNCGIWDYAASIIAKFGDRKEFVLPDRNKYVNMQRHFLSKYMKLVVQTCHSRGAHATGGMAALLLNENESDAIKKVVAAKQMEIETGVDGFMVYDLKLVPHMNNLWKTMCGAQLNQINLEQPWEHITAQDLLKMPSGGVTMNGLQHNVIVALLFLYNWLQGNGHFFYQNCVEDSATAEISRSQIWQWIRHKATIEGSGMVVTTSLVQSLSTDFLKSTSTSHMNKRLLLIAERLFFDIITALEFPDFITTYLNDNLEFQLEHTGFMVPSKL